MRRFARRRRQRGAPKFHTILNSPCVTQCPSQACVTRCPVQALKPSNPFQLRPNRAKLEPKSIPKSLRGAQEAQETSKTRPRELRRRPKSAQEAPKRGQEASRASQTSRKWTQKEPKTTPNPFFWNLFGLYFPKQILHRFLINSLLIFESSNL